MRSLRGEFSSLPIPLIGLTINTHGVAATHGSNGHNLSMRTPLQQQELGIISVLLHGDSNGDWADTVHTYVANSYSEAEVHAKESD